MNGIFVLLLFVCLLIAYIDYGTAKINERAANVRANAPRLEPVVLPVYTAEEAEIFEDNVRNAGVADNIYIEDAILALRSVGCSAKEAKSIVNKLASEKMYYSFEEFFSDAIRSL